LRSYSLIMGGDTRVAMKPYVAWKARTPLRCGQVADPDCFTKGGQQSVCIGVRQAANHPVDEALCSDTKTMTMAPSCLIPATATVVQSIRNVGAPCAFFLAIVSSIARSRGAPSLT
jgi:hypothetical protein